MISYVPHLNGPLHPNKMYTCSPPAWKAIDHCIAKKSNTKAKDQNNYPNTNCGNGKQQDNNSNAFSSRTAVFHSPVSNHTHTDNLAT